MKRNNKGFDYCYNAQATVDAEHQIIVAAEITTAANVQGVTDAGLDPYFAVGRNKHHAPEAAPGSDVPSGSADPSSTPAACSGTATENPKTAMAKKVRTATGRALYAARKHIVEPVFGQIKRIRGFRKFLLRGLENVSGEWQLICLTHNLLKIWRHVSSVP